MPSIVGGMDIHRKQVTFDYLDLVTGEVECGQIAPADRAGLRAWLRRFDGVAGVAFAVEACAGWRYVAEELQRAGIEAHLARPLIPRRRGDARCGPRPTRLTRGCCGTCWRAGACRSAGSRRRRSWSTGRCWRPTMTCAASTPPGCSASMRSCSTTARRCSMTSAGRTHRRSWPPWPARTCHRQAKQQIALYLRMLEVTGGKASTLRAQLVAAAGQLLSSARRPGRAAVWRRARHRAGIVLLARRRRAVLLRAQGGPVHRPGRHRLLQRQQALPRPPVTAGTAGAALVRIQGRQDPRPHRRPRSRLLRGGERPQGRQARRPVRGPQDRPQGMSHPGRARRRRVRHGVTRPG